ncbi:conserved exported hypothetical protein [Oceanicaulis sp. 350]|nr:conserved exported hypothetical protein [Oceanicaulis sp. 350]
MYKLIIVVSASALALGACGTITRGSNDTWEVSTTPIGASVQTSNGYSCDSTPCAIKMPRRSEFVATITRDGYEDATVNVTHQVSGQGGAAMAGNVLVGGIIGAGIDASTGAMHDLTPNPVHLELVPISPELQAQSENEMAAGEPVSR